MWCLLENTNIILFKTLLENTTLSKFVAMYWYLKLKTLNPSENIDFICYKH
jgi:hypothetical protein